MLAQFLIIRYREMRTSEGCLWGLTSDHRQAHISAAPRTSQLAHYPLFVPHDGIHRPTVETGGSLSARQVASSSSKAPATPHQATHTPPPPACPCMSFGMAGKSRSNARPTVPCRQCSRYVSVWYKPAPLLPLPSPPSFPPSPFTLFQKLHNHHTPATASLPRTRFV